ncbi:MAG: 50S ribosomal protein L9 [Cyclobacteriaceae bacterium]|nr:50S ribosomal protein L9 [Cyclobacteriaceae bacterium]MDH5608447.1 50S ribosomal protein L9 [Cyclobacteriaceae bacterium]
MEIILKEDIKGLGYKNDIVAVKPGYGRNYLIPQGMAILANKSNRKIVGENIRQAAHKAEKALKDAQSMAERIGELTLELKTKAGESGKIFGAVTVLQVSDALAAKGYEIDRKKITLPHQIKEIGEHTAILDLHKEVHHKIKLDVVAE